MTRPITIIARSAALMAALFASTTALQATPAAAAPYLRPIDTCGATAKTTGWTPFGPQTAGIDVGQQCPPVEESPTIDPNSSPYRSGLYVTDTLGPVDTAGGTDAGWQFDAPAGTKIARAELWRAMHKQDDNGWRMYFKLGAHDDPTVAEEGDCVIVLGDTSCGGGGWGWLEGATDLPSYVSFSGLETRAVSFGVRCDASVMSCLQGFTLHHVRALVYEARFTLDDPTPPSAPTADGPAWVSGEWLQREQDVDVSGDDPQDGVSATRVLVDGRVVEEQDRADDPGACDWSNPHPCSPADASYTIDTRDLADGEHALAVEDVNAAGVATRTTRSTPLRVDNHAPAPPTGLVAARVGDSNTFNVRWRLPEDHGSPVTAARWQVCTPICGAPRGTADMEGVAGVTLPSTRDGTLRVWLVDQLGHEDADSAATVTLPYLAPPPPPQRTDDGTGGDEGPRDGSSGHTATTPPATTPVDPGDTQAIEPPPSLPAPPSTTRPATSPVPAHAKLRILAVRPTKRALRLSGAIAPAATGKVTATLTVGTGNRTRRVRAVTRVRHGRWAATLKLPAQVRGRRATLTVTFPGSRGVAAASARRTVARA